MDRKGKNVKSVEIRPRNNLDSSAPEPRGKERVTPKVWKPKPFRCKINDEINKLKAITLESTEKTELPKDPSEPHENDDPDSSSSKSVDKDVKKSPDDHQNKKITTIDQKLFLGKFTDMDIKNDLDTLVDIILHPPFHREYVNQALTSEIEYTFYTIMIKLIRFQDRVYHKNPEKLNTKRRYVRGFNEVKKMVRLNKAKAVIIAADIQKIKNDGILDQTVNDTIKSTCEKQIPVIFTSTRNRLGKLCHSHDSNFSCVAILDYNGAQDHFHKLITLTDDAKEVYKANRIKLTDHLKSLSEVCLMEIFKFLKENNQIPESLQIYRETIYSPLQRNIHCYIKAINKEKN